VLEAVSRGVIYSTGRVSAVLIDGLVDIGQQQNVRAM